MFFHVLFGARSCNYNEALSVSGNGAFTFDYAYPFLYVTDEGASGDSVLKIYDVTDASGPVLKSTTSLTAGSGARNPRIFGTHLYIPYAKSSSLAIFDVADSSNPSLLSETYLSDLDDGTKGAFAVGVIGTTACVGCGPGFLGTKTLVKLDVSNPASPSQTGSLRPYNAAIQSSCLDILISNGNFIVAGVVTGGSSSPYVAVVAPSAFTTTGIVTFGTSGGSASLIALNQTDGNYVYLMNGTNGTLHSIDISTPASPTEASSLTVSSPSWGTGSGTIHPMCSVPSVNRLYFGKAGGSGGLQIFICDISTPSTPSQTSPGFISTSGETTTCLRDIDGCAGFAWGQGTGAAIHLLGTAPTS